jgi:hypothetical protein
MACATGLPAARAVRDDLGRRAPSPFQFRYVNQCISLGRRTALVQCVRADDSPVEFVLTGRIAAGTRRSSSAAPSPRNATPPSSPSPPAARREPGSTPVLPARPILRETGARPRRMRATDYEQHVATARDRGTPLPPLTGAPVDALWDPELTPAMTALGVAVQEESALELLLTDLSRDRSNASQPETRARPGRYRA